MTNEEKLRALLAEAREWVGGWSGMPWPSKDITALRNRIDAALAEPYWSSQVLDAALEHEAKQIRKSHSEFLTQLQRERDEARAEVERLRALLDTQSILLAEVGSRPAEQRVLELEMEIAVARTEKDCAFRRGAEAMRGIALCYAMNLDDVYEIRNAIRALPLPKDKP